MGAESANVVIVGAGPRGSLVEPPGMKCHHPVKVRDALSVAQGAAARRAGAAR